MRHCRANALADDIANRESHLRRQRSRPLWQDAGTSLRSVRRRESRCIVSQGLALGHHVHFSTEYVSQEAVAAEINIAGTWKRAFIAPWDWRHRDKQTVVLRCTFSSVNGASSINSPSFIRSGTVTRSHDQERQSEGVSAFTTCREISYGSINISRKSADVLLEEEAQAAGWRKAQSDMLPTPPYLNKAGGTCGFRQLWLKNTLNGRAPASVSLMVLR